MPGPLSWCFHHLPKPLHRVEVAANHVTQLVVPSGCSLPQPVAGAAAAVIVVTQLWLVLSGNFSWLNWMTIVPGLPPLRTVSGSAPARPAAAAARTLPVLVRLVCVVVAALLARRSATGRPATSRLRHQQMNARFDPLHLVNTYGAFGSITRTRYEIVIEGTDEPQVAPARAWREYGSRASRATRAGVRRQFAPYHLRLDWLMWFAALSPAYAQPWFLRFVAPARRRPRDAAAVAAQPVPRTPRRRFVRARLYRYRFTTRASAARRRLVAPGAGGPVHVARHLGDPAQHAVSMPGAAIASSSGGHRRLRPG